jgi:hypothetical protein
MDGGIDGVMDGGLDSGMHGSWTVEKKLEWDGNGIRTLEILKLIKKVY